MTGHEAAQVIALLNAAFPHESLEPETVALYTSELKGLGDARRALAAARTITRTFLRFPTIAEIRETYMREAFAASERPEIEAPPRDPDPHLVREIREFSEALAGRSRGVDGLSAPSADPGICMDCEREDVKPETVPRFKCGDLLLCRRCATARARVAAKLKQAKDVSA